jgi:membrane-bound serine protease (ClpP class)
MTARQRFLETITIPNLAFILLIAGILGLFLEFKNPGLLVPGILGGICLLLAFMAFQILPLNSSGLLLIILSVILFIAEIKVQGFGMLGLGGIISFVFGSIILIDSPLKEMRPSMSVIIIIALSFAAIILFLSFKVMQVMKKKTETGIESFIGKIGLAKTDINAESGQVFVYGEWWNAVSEVPIKANSKVMVDEVNNFVLKVSKLI